MYKFTSSGFFMSINKFIDYLKHEKNYSSHTISAYHTDLKGLQDFLQEEYEVIVKEATYPLIRSWITNLMDEELSARSINRKVASLKAYYKYLRVIGELDVNPLEHHKSLKTSHKVQVPFSKKEVNQILGTSYDAADFSSVRDVLIIEIIYITGMRRAELIGLKVNDLNLHSNTILVTGKRNKQRIIPLIRSITEKLSIYLKMRDQISDSETTELFLTNNGVKLYPSLVYRIIKTYFSEVSSKVKKSPHMLRHSFATHLLDEGADLNAVKEILGHASLASTQVYTHTSMTMLKGVYKNAHPRSIKKK